MAEYTERTMLDLLHATYGAVRTQGDTGRRYTIAEHVGDGAGFSASRRLDAVMLDTWPSKGLALHGFEVKVSKSDLRKELQDLAKSGAFMEHLAFFSIIAPSCIVDLSILPPEWGVYCPTADGTRLRAKRKPLMLNKPTGTVDRSFMASFVRSVAARGQNSAALREAERMAFERGEREGTKDGEARADAAERSRDRLAEAIKAFEAASGVSIDSFNGRKMGEAVHLITSGGLSQLARKADGLQRTADELATLAAGLREIGGSE